jgi:cyclopropane fatty-acyl-phospholipid synthase-like methyltransferase
MPGFNDALARWNERFCRPQYVFGEAPNAYLREMSPLLAPGRSLAVADGEGRNSVWLAERCWQVEAFDFSPFAVDKAASLTRRRGVDMAARLQLNCCSWEAFEWRAGRYDNVVAIFIQFASPEEREELFKRMDATLKPGGVLLILGYGAEQLRHNTGGPGVLENLYDETLLRRSFAGYEVLDLRSYEAELDEGPGHAGRSALVGMVARKSV